MVISEKFYEAVADYLYLLERNYPSKSMLKLVGDKYALPSHERVMLYRGLATDSMLKIRRHKQVLHLTVAMPVFIDGFNVCRTIGSYLNGNFIFEGMDGFLRDVSELHRKKLSWPILERALRLIILFLKSNSAGEVCFYFDKPISHSGKMVELCHDFLKEYHLKGSAETVFSPDYCLTEVKSGIVCTADSHIIDQSKVSVFDLARAVLNTNFNPRIFSLK